MERKTFQKQIILDYLKSVKCHPSAETAYEEVKKKIPSISKATVYRVLKNMASKSQIREIEAEVCRYDGDISPHAHFICEKCNNIFDMMDFCEGCGILKNKKTKVGKINSYNVNFYGVCRRCEG